MLHMSELLLTVGEEIRRLRKEHELTQEELGGKIGITREAVSQLERGENEPSDQTLLGLEKVLGLDRRRAHVLMGRIPPSFDETAQLIISIKNLPTPRERLRALRQLPVELQDAIQQLMADQLAEALPQLRESFEA